jgi:hypothetical protein
MKPTRRIKEAWGEGAPEAVNTVSSPASTPVTTPLKGKAGTVANNMHVGSHRQQQQQQQIQQTNGDESDRIPTAVASVVGRG